MPATLSIAMATYNGARFVRAQLESFAAQSRRPEEVVVCDDGSTDGTVEIVRAFAAGAPFAVRVEVNQTNLGIHRNFAKAVGLCGGEIIFLSDQDDVWEASKLEVMAELMEQRPEVGVAFCNAAVVNEDLSPRGYTAWEEWGYAPGSVAMLADGNGFDVLVRFLAVAGAAMAVRARYRDLVLPIPEGWWYDAWMGLVISAVAPTAAVEEPLNQYRQHARQRLGGERKGWWQRYVEAKRAVGREYFARQVGQYEAVRERLHAYQQRGGTLRAGVLEQLEAKLAFLRARRRMRERALLRPGLVLREWWRGHYRQYGHGWRSAVMDLVV